MNLQIQANSMSLYNGNGQIEKQEHCFPISTYVKTAKGFDMFFRHIYSGAVKHKDETSWCYFPIDKIHTPGVYSITKQQEDLIMKYYSAQLDLIIDLSYNDECSVCTEELTNEFPIFIFQCKHTVHVHCCRKNSKELSYYNCPNCRGSVDRIDNVRMEKSVPIVHQLISLLKILKQPKKLNTHPRYLWYSFEVENVQRHKHILKAPGEQMINQFKNNKRSKKNRHEEIHAPQKHRHPNREERPALKKAKHFNLQMNPKTMNNHLKPQKPSHSEQKALRFPELEGQEGWIILPMKKNKPKCIYGWKCEFGASCRHPKPE